MRIKTMLFLLPILLFVIVMPTSAQTPDITGTWTGTASVNSAFGVASLTVTFVVSSQSGGNFVSAVQIDTSDSDPVTLYGRIDTLLGLWQMHAVGYGDFAATRVQGFYTPEVMYFSPASITLDGEYLWYQETLQGYFGAPCVFHVTLTKS